MNRSVVSPFRCFSSDCTGGFLLTVADLYLFIMKYLVVLAIFASVALGSVAQTLVKEYNYTEGYPQGVVYALPKTAVDIDITVSRVEVFPGPFYQYAERFLALSDVVTSHGVEWHLASVDIHTHSEADTSRLFQVLPASGMSNLVSLDANGVLQGVNIDALPAGDLSTDYGIIASENAKFKGFDMSVLGEEALMATSLPKMAELAAKQIYRIREGRAAIMAGEVEMYPDGKALNAMLKRWKHDERKLIELFAGHTAVSSVTHRVTIVPAADISKQVIARISEIEGLVDADNIIGSPIYLDVKGFYPPKPVDLKNKAKKIKGFAYVVPGKAVVTVSADDVVLDDVKIVVPQFGYVSRLSADVVKKAMPRIRFNTATGAVEYISK